MNNLTTGFHPLRRDRLPLETLMDSYKTKGKLSESTECAGCSAVFHAGRWQWMDELFEKSMNARQTLCPACHRVRDHFPAGYVSLSGKFFAEHEQEILQLIRNREARAKANHPLQRIMAVEKTEQDTVVTTTDIHLARNVGEALHHAYQGELELRYSPDQNLLRASWRR
jgi:hypothetical protein